MKSKRTIRLPLPKQTEKTFKSKKDYKRIKKVLIDPSEIVKK